MHEDSFSRHSSRGSSSADSLPTPEHKKSSLKSDGPAFPSLDQRCTTARSIAICWMSRLVNHPPTEEKKMEARQKAANGDAAPKGLSVPTETSGLSLGGHGPRVTSHSSSSSASSVGSSDAHARHEPVFFNNVELVPASKESEEELLHSLREISLSCVPLGLSMESKRSKRRSKNNATPSQSGSAHAPSKETIMEWNAISVHLKKLESLVINKTEVQEALDDALGMEWGEQLEKPPTTVMAAPVAVGEVPKERQSNPSQPFYSPSQHIATLLERNSPVPHANAGMRSTHGEFPSTPTYPGAKSPAGEFLNESTSSVNTNGMHTGKTVGGTFHLESREEMMRRRSAAPHTFYGAESGYAMVNSAATTPASFSVAAAPFTPVHVQSHSLPVSPMQLSATPFLCPYDYILVLDFEATCEERHTLTYLHEIIEFPVVVVDVRLQRVVSEFHRFVRPRYKPQLSDFCKSLTGIRQEDVDSATSLEEVIRQFERWYNATIPLGSRTVFATDGPADFQEFMHVHSVQRQGIRFPSIFYSFIDVKQTFSHFFNCQKGKIKGMLEVLHLPFVGRLHSGLDDARNIATIVIALLQYGCTFCEVPLNHIPFGHQPGVVHAPPDADTSYMSFTLPESTARAKEQLHPVNNHFSDPNDVSQ